MAAAWDAFRWLSQRMADGGQPGRAQRRCGGSISTVPGAVQLGDAEAAGGQADAAPTALTQGAAAPADSATAAASGVTPVIVAQAALAATSGAAQATAGATGAASCAAPGLMLPSRSNVVERARLAVNAAFAIDGLQDKEDEGCVPTPGPGSMGIAGSDSGVSESTYEEYEGYEKSMVSTVSQVGESEVMRQLRTSAEMRGAWGVDRADRRLRAGSLVARPLAVEGMPVTAPSAASRGHSSAIGALRLQQRFNRKRRRHKQLSERAADPLRGCGVQRLPQRGDSNPATCAGLPPTAGLPQAGRSRRHATPRRVTGKRSWGTCRAHPPAYRPAQR